MIGYWFLSPAEEEMTEAALFYDAASSGLGNDFLEAVVIASPGQRERWASLSFLNLMFSVK